MRARFERGAIVVDQVDPAARAGKVAVKALDLGFEGVTIERYDASSGNVPALMYQVVVPLNSSNYPEDLISAALELVSVCRGTSAEQTLAGWKDRRQAG